LGTKYYVLGPPARVKRIRVCPRAWPQPWPEPREGVPIWFTLASVLRCHVAGGYLCLPTWRRAGKRFQGRGVPPPVVYSVVGESRAGRWAGGGRSSNACILSLELQTLTVTRPVENRGSYLSRPSCPRRVVHRLSSASSSHARMPAMESALETSVMMSGQLVVSATASSMLISHPCSSTLSFSAATGHERSRARSWHRSRRTRGSSDSPGRSHETRAHGSC